MNGIMLKIHLGLLDKKRQQVFLKLSHFKKNGYLAGGTASINLASVFDIAAEKAQTLGRRAIWRDYVDLFFLLKWKILTLDKIIQLAKKKFGGEFVETQFLEQLPYFADLQKTPIEFVGKKYSDEEIKSFLEKEVEAYLKKILPR